MNTGIIVLDSSVVIKLFVQEHDRQQAVDLIKFVNKNDIKIVALELLITETLNVCLAKSVPHKTVLKFFETQFKLGLTTPNLDSIVLNKACDIAISGNENCGFPSFNDSVYHSLAIRLKTQFISADHRHKVKSEKFGHIVLLKDWESIFKK
jgi:predicted nucleic acid-binding protein